MTTHPHGEKISAYLDGMLDTWQMRQVAQHLGTCAECRSLQQSFRETKLLLRDTALPVTPGPDFWTSTYRLLRTEGEGRPGRQDALREGLSSRLRRPQKRWAAMAAVAVIGTAVAGPLLMNPAQTHQPLLAVGPVDSVDISSMVRAHTESAARQPLADPDRQTMISADTDEGFRFVDVSAEAAGDGGNFAADAAH